MRLLGCTIFMALMASQAEGRDFLQAGVPASKMAEARALKPPFGGARTAAIVEEGKKLFEGRGTCATCHGNGGLGDGPAAGMLDPPPGSLADCKFHQNRSDGELFWVIKFGSPGSDMTGLIPGTINEDEAWKIVSYIRSLCK